MYKTISILILWLTDLISGKRVLFYYRHFSSFKNKSRDEIRNYQLEKLRQLLEHAYLNVPYYKRLFDKLGFDYKSVNSLDDLKKITPLLRENLQENFDNLTDKNTKYKIISKGSSSGSTGKAVQYLHDEFGLSAGHGAHLFGWSLGNYSFGQKGLHVWGNPSIVKNWGSKSSRFKSRLMRVYRFPAFTLKEKQSFAILISVVKKQKFDYIDGYTNALYFLAKYLDDNNIEIEKVRAVYTTAENLQDFQRELITKKIGPVYDEYASSEIMGVANQTRFSDFYSIIDPHVIVEFDESVTYDDGSHPLLITDLHNRIMPFIRYQNGDLASRIETSPDCKLKFSQLKSVSGRIADAIVLPDGTRLLVPSFIGGTVSFEKIKQYQVVKISDNLLEFRFVISGSMPDDDWDELEKSIENYLGGKIEFKAVKVENIEPSANGKYKLVIDQTK